MSGLLLFWLFLTAVFAVLGGVGDGFLGVLQGIGVSLVLLPFLIAGYAVMVS